MPIYDYRCKSCGVKFDKLMPLVSSLQGACPVCPQCGSTETQRIPSAFALTGSQSGVATATESEPTPITKAPITPKEDIDHWRKLSKKKN
jgi:putative FmdB family regulatory protein